jgi:hypothetical protein
MYVGFITITSLYGEYVVSREVNWSIQLLGFVGMAGLLMYIGSETVSILFKNKEK